MKKFLIFLVLLTEVNIIYSSGIGKAALPLLSVSSFARAEGMGGAFGAIEGGIDSALYNPAGISGVKNILLSFSMQNWIGNMNNTQMGGLYPMKFIGNFSFIISFWGMSDKIIAYDESGLKLDKDIDVNNLFIILSYGRNLSEKLKVGCNLKYINENLVDRKYNNFALDIGLNYIFFEPMGLNLGSTIQNLGNKVNGDIMPVNYKLSASYLIKFKKITIGIENIILGFDFNLPAGAKINYALGSEFNFLNINEIKPAFRFGIKLPFDTGGVSWLSFGAGLNWKNLILDYCLSPYTGISEYVNRITISYKFEGVKEKKVEAKEEKKEIEEFKKEEKLEKQKEEKKKDEFEKEFDEF